jgi:hypothetical protein
MADTQLAQCIPETAKSTRQTSLSPVVETAVAAGIVFWRLIEAMKRRKKKKKKKERTKYEVGVDCRHSEWALRTVLRG